jgi:hypothetical protein
MAKIFVSHAHEDKDAARQITTALSAAGLDPWLDVQELRSGEGLLERIAGVLAEVDHFAIVLTRRAVTKSWVLAEMRMALTSEIEKGRPRVLLLRLDDCEPPLEIRHKIWLDFRGRFDAAVAELVEDVKGGPRVPPIPKQIVVAEIIRNADDELWKRLSAGAGTDWRRSEAADVVRELRPEELEAAVSIGTSWSGQQYKAWEGELVDAIRCATGSGEAAARRILDRLENMRFLEPADDLDYSRRSERAWCDGDILWILRRAARRSGVFPKLPPPLPERLGSLLAYQTPVDITSEGWYAVRFAAPVLSALSDRDPVIAAVARHAAPARTWAFRSPDDRAPLFAERYHTPTGLTPADPFASLAENRDLAVVGFTLQTFDDLGLLVDK